MLCITRRAITVCALLYACVGMAGYTLFGAATEGDVLKNLTVRNTAALVGQVPAELLIPFIVGANTANLLVNFVLKVTLLCRLWGAPGHSTERLNNNVMKFHRILSFPAGVGRARELRRAAPPTLRCHSLPPSVVLAHRPPGRGLLPRLRAAALDLATHIAGGQHSLRHVFLRVSRAAGHAAGAVAGRTSRRGRRRGAGCAHGKHRRVQHCYRARRSLE